MSEIAITTLGRALVMVALIVAIVVLVVAEHPFWAIGAAYMLIAVCDNA